jgi:hypothetical protein
MTSLKTMLSAAALAATLAASAAPVHAAVFAAFLPDSGNSDFRWVNSGSSNNGTGGSLFSITSNTATSAQGVATHFSFLDPALSALAFIPATFTLSATVTPSDPAAVNGAGLWTQTQINGSFSFTYNGPTINNYNGSGINLVSGSNLLSGVFSDAWIQGAGGSGSFNLAQGNGGVATFHSDYEHFAHLIPNTQEFAFNLLSTNVPFGANAGKALKTFRANGGGNFSFAAGVPEPTTWALMIVGFGGVGAMTRARRRQAVATA